MRACYYSPELKRFINADIVAGDISNAITFNRYAYANVNPVSNIDPFGLSADEGRGNNSSFNWLKCLTGAMNSIWRTVEMAVGASLGGTVGWIGIVAVAAGLLMVDGAATAAQGAAQIVNSFNDSPVMREDNLAKTTAIEAGELIGGGTGAAIAGVTYDAAVTTSRMYAFPLEYVAFTLRNQ